MCPFFNVRPLTRKKRADSRINIVVVTIELIFGLDNFERKQNRLNYIYYFEVMLISIGLFILFGFKVFFRM